MDVLLQLLTSPDALKWVVGLLLGTVLVLILRAQQVWSQRRGFGYSVYTADSLRQRLQTGALLGLCVLIVVAGAYVWRNATSANNAAVTPISQTTEPIVREFRLVIPRLAVETPVIEAPIVDNIWDISTLTSEVAHLALTAYPGEAGNTVMVGHITIPNAGWGPFQELATLQPGDEVFVLSGEDQYLYEVFEIRTVDPTEVEVTFPTEDTRLTLITCTTWDEESESYSQRIVVSARFMGDP